MNSEAGRRAYGNGNKCGSDENTESLLTRQLRKLVRAMG